MAGHSYYIGIAECGCERAWLIDDEDTTPKEIAEFAKRQAKMKRRMVHAPTMTWEANPECQEHCVTDKTK